MSKYVLIVDDNEVIRRTLRYLFKENQRVDHLRGGLQWPRRTGEGT